MKLRHEIIDAGLHQNVHQSRKGRRLLQRKQPRRRLIGRPASADHISGHGPGRTAKADQRLVGGQFVLEAPQGFKHRRQVLEHPFRTKLTQGLRGDGLEQGAFALFKANRLSQRIGHDENVRKQNRCIEREPTQGLQRHFHSQIGRIAQIKETFGAGAHFPILGEIASSLAHDPDRGSCLSLTEYGGEKRLEGHLAHSDFPFQTPEKTLVLGISIIMAVFCSNSWPSTIAVVATELRSIAAAGL